MPRSSSTSLDTGTILIGAAIAARRAMLGAPHVTALERLRAPCLAAGRAVPHFDPLDGGDRARLLVLLETPGPGHGEEARFVSRDNPTGTSRNLARFLDGAGIVRGDIVLWNAVPWIVHAPGARNRPVRRGEIAEGLAMLPDLLNRLPRLRAVILAGRVAGEARPIVARERPDAPALSMPHPSPTYVCTSPAVAERIRHAMRQAATILSSGDRPCAN